MTGTPKDREDEETSDAAGIVYYKWIKREQVHLQQNKKKAEAKGKKCHAKTMWSLEKPI